MPISYTIGTQDIKRLVQETMHKYHPCLAYVETRVGSLVACHYNKDGPTDEPAVKLNGYPCAAVVKINSLRDRVQGMADATITFDANTWEQLDEAARLALVDHELEHLEVKAEGGEVMRVEEITGGVIGVPLSDDIGRPKLTAKLHDWQLGGFETIARRHGRHALEVMAARAHIDPESGQYAWDFALVDA